MKKICILSDTHGLLRNEVTSELMQSDVIIHAGDIDTNAVLQKLKQFGTLYAVCGNNDRFCGKLLPKSLFIQIEEVRFWIQHNQKDIPKDLTDADIVVYGHSHVYAAEKSDGILYLNPGSCGKRRFGLGLSFCHMVVDGRSYCYERIIIDQE